MKTVVVGGNSRNIGKTSLACSLIEATKELDWTALKITQFGHGICSSSGEACGCAIDDPECPYEITVETGEKPGSDTARMLRAGARESLWVRVAMGQLERAMPAILARIAGRQHVLIESNSVVEFVEPDVYFSVLNFDQPDFKVSAARLGERVDAFVLPTAKNVQPPWPGFDQTLLSKKRSFNVEPPSYCNADVVQFAADLLR
jgi:hypothetical protein